MAIAPDSSENFAREVDENLRRDQMAETAKKYSGLIIGGVLLFLAAIAGVLYWKDHRFAASQRASEQLHAAFQDIGEHRNAPAAAELAKLTDSKADVVRASATLASAALALQQNDRKAAAAAYANVAADKGLPDAYRQLALVRQTAVEFDSLKPDEVIARLQPLTVPGNPYFGSAGELTGMALLAKGQKAAAGQLFAKIAADQAVPDSLRSRAVQVAGSLGVDASASLPASAQQ